MREETYFVIIDNNPYVKNYVKNKTARTSSTRYAKTFQYQWQAQNYIKEQDIKNASIAKLTTTVSYVSESYSNSDKPMTHKQETFIKRLLKLKANIYRTDEESFPKNINSVKEASAWIAETKKELKNFYTPAEY